MIFIACNAIVMLVVAWLWVRSNSIQDGFEWWRDQHAAVQHGYFLDTGRGGVAFRSMLFTDGVNVPTSILHYELKDPSYAGCLADRSPWSRPFVLSHESSDPLENTWLIAMPLWVFMLVLAAGPMMYLIPALRRRRRRRRGLCGPCGYDLRVTPARCPECGIAPATFGRATG